MTLPQLADWRPITLRWVTHCELCGQTAANDLGLNVYNPATKQIRHLRCHDQHMEAHDRIEVWTADVCEENNDGDPITVRKNVIITQYRRTTRPPKGVDLLELVANYPMDTDREEIKVQHNTKGNYTATSYT